MLVPIPFSESRFYLEYVYSRVDLQLGHGIQWNL